MNYVESPSSGVWRSQASKFQDVASLRVVVTATGGPILLQLVSTATGEPGGLLGSSNAGANATFAFFRFMRDGNALPSFTVGSSTTAAGHCTISIPCSSLATIDLPPEGQHTYTIQARAASNSITGGPHTVSVDDAKLAAIVF